MTAFYAVGKKAAFQETAFFGQGSGSTKPPKLKIVKVF